jgi:tetratricopeptide (TPR) repeat protein
MQTPAPAFAQKAAAAESAEQLEDAAFKLQADGKYAEAIAKYLEAFEGSRDSVLLYNIAHLYDRKLNERELAAAYYRRYSSALDADPTLVKKATDRLTALKREAEAEATRAQAEQAPQSSTAAPAEKTPAPVKPDTQQSAAPKSNEDRNSGLRTGGIVVGAVGVAAVGASLVLGLLAKNKNSEADEVCDGTVCKDQSGVELAKTAGTLADASTIVFFSGLGLIGTGVTLYVLAPSTGDVAPQPTSALVPGIGVSLRGRF